MSSLKHVVDKLHFKGHVGSWCHQNCNPYSIPALKNVNTVICEQTFKWCNAYVNVKAMNEYRFRCFFTYLIDLHNLDSIGELCLSHPTGHGTKAVFENPKQVEDMEPLQEDIDKKQIHCEFCGKTGFGTKSGLKRHIKAIHGDKTSKKIVDAKSNTAVCKVAITAKRCDKVATNTDERDMVSTNTDECDKVPTNADKCDKMPTLGDSSSKCDPITNLLESLNLGSGNPSDVIQKTLLVCERCGKNDFKSKRGLTQHLKTIHKTTVLPDNPFMCTM